MNYGRQIVVEDFQHGATSVFGEEGSINGNGNNNLIVVTQQGTEAVQIDGRRNAKG